MEFDWVYTLLNQKLRNSLVKDNKQMSKIKYFCRSCKQTKPAKLVPSLSDLPSQDEVTKDFVQQVKQPDGSVKESIFRARQLECNHFVRLSDPGMTDTSTDNLNEHETLIIRREIDKTMVGKQRAEVEQQILFHCEQMQTLLKIASKQKMQAKYAIIYLDQLREKYTTQLADQKDKDNFNTRFAHFLELRPTTNKVVEKERTRTDKAADKQKSLMEEMKSMLSKKGFSLKDLKGLE